MPQRAVRDPGRNLFSQPATDPPDGNGPHNGHRTLCNAVAHMC